MEHVKTASGFEVEIDKEKLDDLEIVELICGMQDGDVKAYVAMERKILTAEDRERLHTHLRLEDGRVPFSAVMREISDIFTGLNDGKK